MIGKVSLTLATAVFVSTAAAQVPTNSTATPMGRAVMAERNGAYADAAQQYTAMLAHEPANLGALVGLEHVLPKLDRRAELIPLLQRAVAADSTSTGILGVAVRQFATMGKVDSARHYAERWSARSPGDEEPYREWSEAALLARDVAQARLALDIGRARLGANALGIERAEMLMRTGDMNGAVDEWIGVVHQVPTFRDGAVNLLGQVAVAQRNQVRDALGRNGSIEARQMLGLLLAQWGDPERGAAMVRGALPTDPDGSAALLRKLLELLRTQDGPAARIAVASTLEELARHQPGPAGTRDLVEAARAYADAGDERNARRLLTTVAASGEAPPALAAVTSTTLLNVLIREGKAEQAESTLQQLRGRIDADDYDRMARRTAMTWARRGEFDRAELLIAADSSTQGFDLRGRLRMFRGDLAGANDMFKQAGPFDEEREQALERVTLLALIQAVGTDSSVALGSALLALERGDSAAAINQLVALAPNLVPAGAAGVRLLAGRLSLQRADTSRAMLLLQQADVKEAPAEAAAARLDQARIAAARGGMAQARDILERLIVDYPESAVVPEARRLRDTLRPTGADR